MLITNIPKLYTAAAEWLSCAVFILLLKKRWSKGITAAILTSSLAVFCVIQIMIGRDPLHLWIPGMFVAVLIMFATILLSCDVRPLDAGFYWALAFIYAEFIASADWQFYTYYAQRNGHSLLIEWILLAFFYGGGYVSFYFLEKIRLAKLPSPNVSFRELQFSIIISIGTFLISNLSYFNTNTPLSGSTGMDVFYIRTLVDFAGVLLMLSQQDRWIELHARYEKDAIHALLQRQYEQFKQSQEIQNLINQKYHDLKHQIGVIRMEKDDQKKEEYLRQLEEGIGSFRTSHQTGNSILDTILTTKHQYCLDQKIELNVVVDGSRLDFLETMDICYLFGNALDNAIESAQRIEDPDKRLIRLAVYTQNMFLMIRVENYFESPLLRNDADDFQTTKNDPEFHGYGLKSIRYRR